ncbi:hypothetical protein ABID65_006679 [Bradyrhizobium sp. S3.9.2]|uniref:hypothetical protein n=1 Tax=Bradyrhizobium sp. S3.9.2 TaxID=3156432 RepID=UPI003398E407
MIDWKKCSEALPEDAQECILYSDTADAVIGPIAWSASMGGWLDIFATPEAGVVYKPGAEHGPSHWTLWNEP